MPATAQGTGCLQQRSERLLTLLVSNHKRHEAGHAMKLVQSCQDQLSSQHSAFATDRGGPIPHTQELTMGRSGKNQVTHCSPCAACITPEVC